MPQLETMTVRLKKSTNQALANINVFDFDPELHQKIEESDEMTLGAAKQSDKAVMPGTKK